MRLRGNVVLLFCQREHLVFSFYRFAKRENVRMLVQSGEDS